MAGCDAMGNATLSQIELNNSINEGKAMKLNKKLLATAVACGAFALTPLANADTGTINFTGLVKPVSCNIEINGEAVGVAGDLDKSAASITMPTVYTNELTAEGVTAGDKLVDIVFTDCDANELAGATMQFDSAGVNQETGYLLNTAAEAAENVEIQLSNTGGAVINLNTDNSDRVEFDNEEATISLTASYVATDDVITAGNVEASVVYTIAYD